MKVMRENINQAPKILFEAPLVRVDPSLQILLDLIESPKKINTGKCVAFWWVF